jgi:hypothetical protein
MTHMFVGATPSEPLVLTPPVDLSQYTEAVVVVGETTISAEIDGDDVIVTLRAINAPGLYPVTVRVTNAGRGEEFDFPAIAVEDRQGWHTISSARREWADAPLEDAVLYELLSVARGQVEAFAPSLPAPVETPAQFNSGWILMTPIQYPEVPANYRLAQLVQARNVWTATKPDSNTGFGDGDFMPAPSRPLDWHVKNLLRPKSGAPRIG